MIVYSGTKRTFEKDIVNGVIAERLHSLFTNFGIGSEGKAEYNSWKASLPRIGLIVADRRIDDNVQVALEYQIPLTAKRVDFMVAGNDGSKDNVVIVELKQWEDCTPTSRENVVKAFTGGAQREVAHPSQQAYSYARMIENFNEAVRENNIGLVPCAYLHNYKEGNRVHICHPSYREAIADAPVFLQQDGDKLSEFIADYVTKPSRKDLFDIIENGKLKPSKALQDTVGYVLNGNEEYVMIDEQQVAYATVLKLVENTIKDSEKHAIIVQGGPGTGKSVIAINLLAKITNNGYSCVYCSKTSAPRYTFAQHLIKGKHKLGYLKGLFKGAGDVYKLAPDTYDCMLVDEAHRLAARSGLYSKGKNQVREIMQACKISVFFVDEDQIVTTKDIGTIDEIERQAADLGIKVHKGPSLTLTSQFRCNGSDGYMAFVDDVLGIRHTANRDYFDLDYDIRVFRDASAMREALREKNDRNKARMIAGYCYPWNSQKDKSGMDIILPGGFEAQWNFSTEAFATDPDSFEQVGCIHSTQGLEFDYVGLIIGKDLIYRDGEVKTDRTAIADSDHSSGIKGCKDAALADRLLRNTYKVLMTRGQKGCYIYCEDEALGAYMKERISACQAAKALADRTAAPKPVSVIEPEHEHEKIDYSKYIELPIYGAIAAGLGIEMLEDVEGTIPTPRSLLHPPEPGKYFWLRVSGDSMVDAEIYDGDYALIRRMSNPKADIHSGDIVAFQIHQGEATLKRYFDKGDYIVLHPENDAYPDIEVPFRDLYTGDAAIIGKMIRCVHKEEID